VDVFVTSDQPKTSRGTLEWRVTDLQGALLNDGNVAVEIPSRKSQRIRTLDLMSLSNAHGGDNLLVWLRLLVNEQEISRNLVTFARPKEINLLDPQLKTEIAETNSGFKVKLSAAKPALWAWLSLPIDARFSENFVHLDGQTPSEITVVPSRPLSRAEFEQALTARSLYDTYSDRLSRAPKPAETVMVSP
jgi:hypothetical protein